jgi:hypothetical protein
MNDVLSPTISSVASLAEAANITKFDFWELMNWMAVSHHWAILLDFGQVSRVVSNGSIIAFELVFYPTTNIFVNETHLLSLLIEYRSSTLGLPARFPEPNQRHECRQHHYKDALLLYRSSTQVVWELGRLGHGCQSGICNLTNTRSFSLLAGNANCPRKMVLVYPPMTGCQGCIEVLLTKGVTEISEKYVVSVKYIYALEPLIEGAHLVRYHYNTQFAGQAYSHGNCQV